MAREYIDARDVRVGDRIIIDGMVGIADPTGIVLATVTDDDYVAILLDGDDDDMRVWRVPADDPVLRES